MGFEDGVLVLLIWQLVTAIRTMVSRAELIRRVLRPISDLAQQTQTLSQGQGPLSIEEMQTLAGTLDEINAARLDTRIDLDTTQDELKNLAVAINGLLDRMRESYRLQPGLFPMLPMSLRPLHHPRLCQPFGPLGKERPRSPPGVH